MTNDSLASVLKRGLAVWVLMILAESAHGAFRRLLLEPLMGDLRARQVSVVTGSLLIIAITFVFVRWLKGSRVIDFVLVGVVWVALTAGFEIAIGRFAMDLSWESIASDYNIAAGGLMPLGLLVMLMAPLSLAKLYDEV